MPKLTIAGHPLHPILSDGWTLFPFSLTMDLLAATTGRRGYADAAHYSLVGGYSVALLAAAAGIADYLTIPRGTSTKRTANLHAALNTAAMGLYTINLVLRQDERRRTGALPILLSLVGTSILGLSASYGGELVYAHGMRVRGSNPVRDAPELKLLPGDDAIHAALSSLANATPAGGPELDAPRDGREAD